MYFQKINNRPLKEIIYKKLMKKNIGKTPEEPKKCTVQMSSLFGEHTDKNLNRISRYVERRSREKNFFEVRLYAASSKIHGIGVFAGEYIKAGTRIIEYVGEIIGEKVADQREKFYKKNRIWSIYLFKISDDVIIDATLKGNLARFLNHSCQPSAVSRTVGGKIFIYSQREIKKDEEITFYYNFSSDENDDPLPCYCGHEFCENFIV